MKVYKAKILGVDDVNIKDKVTGQITRLYRYYISIGNAKLSGIKTDITYGKNLVKDEFIPVVSIANKYKVVEFEST